MTQTQSTKATPPRTDPANKDSLDRIRAAAQDLHGAISDAVAKGGQAIKSQVDAIAPKAEALSKSIESAIDHQSDLTKKHLREVVTHLAATQKHLAESLTTSGQAFETAVRQALADSRSAVQRISEIVATIRSTHATPNHKA